MAPDHSRVLEAARREFPIFEEVAYLNTSAVAAGNLRLARAYKAFIDEWTAKGFDFVRAERAADASRAAFARVIGARSDDVALIPSVSAAAGLVAAQFTGARPGENLVIGAQEYSSNHFPWRQLEARGYDVRQVAFRGGGICPDDLRRVVDGGTRLVALSAVQTATGHRSDLSAVSEIAHAVGAWIFVDGSQSIGALETTKDLPNVDFLVTSDHKFLLNAARGIGYMYIRPEVRAGLLPLGAGWKAGRVPFESFFGPRMELSETASKFDASISWLAAVGDEICLRMIEEVNPIVIEAWITELAECLRQALQHAGLPPLDLAAGNRSHVVCVPLAGRDAGLVLSSMKASGVVCAARDGNLRFSLHFYNDHADIERAVVALRAAMRKV
jgi:cysteine desulfurase/selenocysteine lyase